jgi:hypothetical protein
MARGQGCRISERRMLLIQVSDGINMWGGGKVRYKLVVEEERVDEGNDVCRSCIVK